MLAVVVFPAAFFAVFFAVVLVFFLVAVPATFFLAAVPVVLDAGDFFFAAAVLLTSVEARFLVAFFAVDVLLVEEPDAATPSALFDFPGFFEMGFFVVFFLLSTEVDDDLRGRVANSHPHEQKTLFAPVRFAFT